MVFSVSDRVCPGEKESNAKIIATEHILFNVMIVSSFYLRLKIRLQNGLFLLTYLIPTQM